MTPLARVGGRLLVVDPDERVLLVHERIEGGTHWLTPGGGVEAGEDPRTAAVREAVEEVGLTIDLPADQPTVLTTRRQWSWDGITYDQVDHFFLARVTAGLQVRPQALTAMERQTVLGHAWWTVAELRDTHETVLPQNLGDVLNRILHGPGAGG